MINKDFKNLNRNKPLFSKQKRSKKPLFLSLAGLATVAALGYGLTQKDKQPTDSVVQQETLPFANTPAALNDQANATNQLSGELNLGNDIQSETHNRTESTAAPLDKATKQESKPTEALEILASKETELPAAQSNLSLSDRALALASQPLQNPSLSNALAISQEKARKAAIKWEKMTVNKGDTLAKIFQRQGYSASDLHYLMRLKDSENRIEKLKSIRSGHTLEFSQSGDESAGFTSLRYPYSKSETLIVTKTGDKSFESSIEKKPITYKERFATATINSSFYNAGKKAGLPDGVIMKLADVFEYDIDFALEIRKGDSFLVLYQEKYIDGKKAGYGNILSAEFINQGDKYAAVRYTDSKNRTAYYTPKGKALRKSFLRAPLQFNYVSSNFNPRRFHPIQKRVKPHRGVDYRAATGTPVRTSGDGRVIRSSYDKYNGHHVFVQHGNNIVTKYLHFSKRRVKKGQRVKQGQVIGYVGSTGLSQAPHLHYEFIVNGVHRNPRTVKLPHAAPVAKKEMTRFKQQTKPYIQQLEQQSIEHFAKLKGEKNTKKVQ